jgi:hypothetical protein
MKKQVDASSYTTSRDTTRARTCMDGRTGARSRVGAIIKLKTRRCCHASSVWWQNAAPLGGRITAMLNRELKAEGLALANHKRVYRMMKINSLLLERSRFDRPNVAMMAKGS